MTDKSSTIEAIYPLSSMQKAFLFHHLNEEKDQGFLQVRIGIRGKINANNLKKAWSKAIQRHTVLRTTLHWNNIEKPVQVVHKKEVFHEKLSLKETPIHESSNGSNRRELIPPFSLSKAPAYQVSLVQKSEDSYILVWDCHHILLDGWSASIIIKDVFDFYDAIHNSHPDKLEPLPSYSDYLNFINNQDMDRARLYWKEKLDGLNALSLFSNAPNQENRINASFKEDSFSLTVPESEAFNTFIKKINTTPNIIIKGLWAILLSCYFQSKSVIFGSTVSGRSSSLPGIESMSGLFMNVLPVKIEIREGTEFGEWIRLLQSQQAETLNFEHITLDQILSWINIKHHSLFDNLLVFENFPWKEFSSGDLVIQNFKGGLTTMYPLTLIVTPGPKYKFRFRYDSNTVTRSVITWLTNQFGNIFQNCIYSHPTKVDDLRRLISEPPERHPTIDTSVPNLASRANGSIDYHPPQNETELRLTSLWERILRRSPIGVNEQFFDIGGTSLMAVQLLSLIDSMLGYNLPPVTLIQNPTVRLLAKAINGKDSPSTWSSLVPLRASGTSTPLFCLHGGGGHVFYYNPLANHLPNHRPVYSIQPVGLGGFETLPDSIEEMAGHYLAEIRKIQPNGPYYLLGYCFSVALLIEMSIQLQAIGEPTPIQIIVDSSPPRSVDPDPAIEHTKLQKLKRLTSLSPQEFRTRLSTRFHLGLESIKDKWKQSFENQQASKLRKTRENMDRIFLEYNWRPFRGKIILIRSEEYFTADYRNTHIRRWQALAQDGMEVHVIPGKHTSIFSEPDVRHLANQVEQCMEQAQKQATAQRSSI